MEILRPSDRLLCLLLINGWEPKQIAAILRRSPYGVRNQFRHMYEKTGCADMLELAIWYVNELRKGGAN